ncbi:hypothetical protein HHL17_11760 [Chitinophaga sp. G-6-1-13]|uniref:Methyltransferase FkbM domain-containing protein n=1 Tax=Chitinophaga fulva TaxID=2728842 RepID=A0A848GJL0_9BACT|nr:FkbM family methyltransferase [Chitinophaga fulva]NML37871.1 hypothetical protein [Chitinophaga fulva]
MKSLQFLKPLSLKNKVRLGPNKDSGYIVYGPALKETDVLLTYGVGWEVSFEVDFNARTGAKVIMFDPSMFGKYMLNFKYMGSMFITFRWKRLFTYLYLIGYAWIKRRAMEKKKIFFVNEGVDAVPADRYNTMQHHYERFGLSDKQVLLKMDIEGTEYRIWEQDATYGLLGNVNQILIEFHDVKNLFRRFKKIVEKLRENYELVHIHGNNWGPTFCLYDLPDGKEDWVIPDTLELTFVRKDKIAAEDVMEPVAYPIEGLDFPNNPRQPDYRLDFIGS